MKLAGIAVALAFGLAGCGGTTSPSGPSVVPATISPPADAAGLRPTIEAIEPSVVSTAGTWGTITGTHFQPGATLKIGTASVGVVFRDSTTLQFPNSGAHAPGAVSVTVTNPGAPPVTVVAGYTFAPPESFDMNGEWVAHADAQNDYTIDMRFTIKDNALASLSCGSPVAMPNTVSVPTGRFSFSGADGLAFSAGKGRPRSLARVLEVLGADRPQSFRVPEIWRLDDWARRGVLLLNPVLTVEVGRSASHMDCGWQALTLEIAKYLANLENPPTFLLWGAKAQAFWSAAGPTRARVLTTRHPSYDFQRTFMAEGSHFEATAHLVDWWAIGRQGEPML